MNARALLLVLVVGCGGGKSGTATTTTTTNSADPETGSASAASGSAAGSAHTAADIGIALDVTPKDATVTIDDIVMGRAEELDPVVSLAPGLHTLVVEQTGYKSYRAEFAVTDKVEKFTVRLEATK